MGVLISRKQLMGRFWVDDDFIRIHARKLSNKAVLVYIGLCSHASREGFTFIGQRSLGKELGLNKETIGLAIKELIASGFAGHYKRGRHGVYGLTVFSVRKYPVLASGHSGPKEEFKELYKEGNLNKVEPSPIIETLRKRWSRIKS